MDMRLKILWKVLPGTLLGIAALNAGAQIALTEQVTSEAIKPQTVEELCAGFQKSEVLVDRQKVQRFVISKSEFLRCLPPQPAAPWKVIKEVWSEQDEANFKNFVRSIGKGVEAGNCNTVDTCLASSANPYRSQMDIDATHFADCADFPMYLRNYFAFKNQLPMSFGVGLEANPATPDQIAANETLLFAATDKFNQVVAQNAPAEEIRKRMEQLKKLQAQHEDLLNTRDTRYTRNGNHFTSRVNMPHSRGVQRDFFSVSELIQDGVSSGSYRMLMTGPNQIPADFYAPAINKQSIQIGTVSYLPAGHLAIIYEITKNGDIWLIDSHPDNSLTRVMYSRAFERSLPTHGAGFKNWRPLQVVDSKKDSQGYISQGKIVFSKDEEIPNFSLEQYFGNADINNTESAKAKWIVGPRTVDWYDYVKIRMANGVYKQDPLFDLQTDLSNLCMNLQGRAVDVDTALKANIATLAHPANLPQNIYGADGDWEAYSTPGRDLRIRKIAKDVIENTKRYFVKYQSRDPYFSYAGTNLKRDLIKVYNQVNAQCVVSYTNTQGNSVKLGMGTALKRLTKMSFDPYLCAEKRWGAVSQAESVTCADDLDKAQWYQFQQFLRNLTDKDTNAVMGWSLEQLKEMERSRAVDNSDHSGEYNILKKLSEL